MEDAVILSAVRTPIGRYAGSLKDVRPDDLAATLYEALGIAHDTVLHDLRQRPHRIAEGIPIRAFSITAWRTGRCPRAREEERSRAR